MLYTAATSNPAAQARSVALGFSPPASAEWADISSDTGIVREKRFVLIPQFSRTSRPKAGKLSNVCPIQ